MSQSTIIWPIIALAFVILTGALFYPVLRLKRQARWAWLVVFVSLLAIAPLVVPATMPLARVIAAIFAVSVMMKIYDVHLGVIRGHRPGLAAYLRFLPNFFSMVQRKTIAWKAENSRHYSTRIRSGSVAVKHSVVCCSLAALPGAT